MTFLYLKAVHIVFIVTWFAGLFYMPRLLIYITEAFEKPEPEKDVLIKNLTLMASRLWVGITWPSAIITAGMGTALLIIQPYWLQFGFMQIKLLLVVFLYLYHFSLQVIFNQLKKGRSRYSSIQLRLWNEVATLFLVSIVFLIVLKNELSAIWGLVGLACITVFILIGMRFYKKIRK